MRGRHVPGHHDTWTLETLDGPAPRHALKCQPEPFRHVWEGRKTYEVRQDDRGAKEGDELLLQEWIPNSVRAAALAREGRYSGREVLAVIVHKTPGGRWGLPRGLAVFGIEILERREAPS